MLNISWAHNIAFSCDHPQSQLSSPCGKQASSKHAQAHAQDYNTMDSTEGDAVEDRVSSLPPLMPMRELGDLPCAPLKACTHRYFA